MKNTHARLHHHITPVIFPYIVTKMLKPKMIEKREKNKKEWKK